MHRVVRFLMAALGGSLVLASALMAQPPVEAEPQQGRMQLYTAAGGPCCGDSPHCRNWWAVAPHAVHLRWQGHCGGDCNYQQEIGGCDCGHGQHCGGGWLDRLFGRCRGSCDACDSCERGCQLRSARGCTQRGCSPSGCSCAEKCTSCESKGCDCKPVGCDTRPSCQMTAPMIPADREVNPFRDDPAAPQVPSTPKPLTPKAEPLPPRIPESDMLNSSPRPAPSVVTASFSAPSSAPKGNASLMDRHGFPAPVHISSEELAQPASVKKPSVSSRSASGNSLRIRDVRDVQR